MYLLDIKSSPSLTGQNSNISMSSIKLNLLTKNNLEPQNPRRDTSIPSVSAGLGDSGVRKENLTETGNQNLLVRMSGR